MISAAGVNNVFADDVIVFVSVASVSPKDLSHDVHTMVRNSMGSALFLDLTVTLPSGSGSRSRSDIGTGSDVPSLEEVEREAECAGWRYPTVILRERDEWSRRRRTPPTLGRRRKEEADDEFVDDEEDDDEEDYEEYEEDDEELCTELDNII